MLRSIGKQSGESVESASKHWMKLWTVPIKTFSALAIFLTYEHLPSFTIYHLWHGLSGSPLVMAVLECSHQHSWQHLLWKPKEDIWCKFLRTILLSQPILFPLRFQHVCPSVPIWRHFWLAGRWFLVFCSTVIIDLLVAQWGVVRSELWGLAVRSMGVVVRERGGMVRGELWGVADSEQLLHHIEGTVTSLHRCYHFVFECVPL